MELFTNSIDKEDYLINTLLNYSNCPRVSIAAPFFTENEFLNKLIDNNSKIRLVVRLCIATSYFALEKIINNPNITIKFFTEQNFHSKIFVFDELYIIVGSSNFTNGGLKNNREINFGIPYDDTCFDDLNKLYEEYWRAATTLTKERLDRFKEIINHNQGNKIDSTVSQDLEDQVFKKTPMEKAREVRKNNKGSWSPTDEQKKKISDANKGKVISPEHLKLMNESAKLHLSKPVVCLNTGVRYNSMLEAAEQYYYSKRSYGYISDVCKGKKEHYKRDIWRFEDDYLKLSKNEIQAQIDELNKESEVKEKYKEKTKLLFRDKIYDSMADLGKFLTSNTSHYDFRSISALINQYRKLNCSFFKINTELGTEYVYFADYYQIFKNGQLIEEEPVENTIHAVKANCEKVFDIELGDMKIVDALTSKQLIFCKYEGKYYRSMASIKNQCFDRELSKKELLRLIKNNDYQLLWKATEVDIILSSKKTYYIKNNTIFKNKNDYIDRNVTEIKKDDMLIELGIDW